MPCQGVVSIRIKEKDHIPSWPYNITPGWVLLFQHKLKDEKPHAKNVELGVQETWRPIEKYLQAIGAKDWLLLGPLSSDAGNAQLRAHLEGST